MAQWVNISECARLYGRSRKWVDNRIKKHNIGTEKSVDGNEKRFQLVDFIAQCGEPDNNGTAIGTAPHNGSEHGSTPSPGDNTVIETALLRQENQLLHRRIEELESERAQMQEIIETRLLALPPLMNGEACWIGSSSGTTVVKMQMQAICKYSLHFSMLIISSPGTIRGDNRR